MKFSSGLLKKIWHYSELPQTAVSLRQMCQFGSHPTPGLMFKASCFALQELPIRLAHRIKELESLPNGLNRIPEVIEVRNWYTQSFKELYEFTHNTELSQGKLYQMLYGGLRPNTFVDKQIVSDTIGLLYTEYELGHRVKDTTISVLEKDRTFVDDGLVVPHFAKKPHHQNNVRKGIHEGYPLLSKKYYSALPSGTMEQWSKSQDFYQFWSKDILMFNSQFFKVLQNIKVRHDATVVTLAKGVLKWKKTCQQNVVDDSVQSFLDRFYLSRIGIRMLIGQHLELLQASLRPSTTKCLQEGEDDDNYVGIICTKTNITEISEDAIATARHICSEHYGLFEAPKVDLLCFPLGRENFNDLTHKEKKSIPDIEFMYVPGHLIHMLVETLKNALRATVEKTLERNPNKDIYDLKFPDIKVIISEGSEDITIKISDEGGGIARSNLPLVWTYLYTTMPDDSQQELIGDNTNGEGSQNASTIKAPMAGYGYGLALSRLYARYFGGDLKLISMEGFGTDVYLQLNRLSSSSEPLP